MLRSPWLWITIALIVAGVALTAALGVLAWLIALLGAAVLLSLGVFLHAAFAVGQAQPPVLPELTRRPGERRVRLIYDCDVTLGRPFHSVGDGLALLYLLGEPNVELRAVTTTYGNGSVGMTTRTARHLLDTLNLHHVVVARGAGRPDGDPSQNEAARTLVEAAHGSPDEIVVLATGPLTNLRHASMLDPHFFEKLRSLYLMGGVMGQSGELTWNERRLVERNFSSDPEGAYLAIHSDCPTTIAPGEAGLTAIFRSPQFAALQALDGPAPRLIARRIRLWYGLMRLWFRDDGFPLWESVAALAVTHPDLFEFRRAHLPITVEDLHSGRLVTDPRRAGPVRLVSGVREFETFMEIQLAAWQRLNLLMIEPGTTSVEPNDLAPDPKESEPL
ncbi:MAG: nucleoside hydrolase [Anaerolineae bacterium]